MTPITGKDIDARFKELAEADQEYQRLVAVDERLRGEAERAHKIWEETKTYSQRAHAQMATKRRDLRLQARQEIERLAHDRPEQPVRG